VRAMRTLIPLQTVITLQPVDHPRRSNAMNHPDNLIDRIERLERANFRMRLAIATFMAGSLILVGLGATPKNDLKILDAEKIILRGDGGKIIAELSSDPIDHDPQLTLWSNNERYRMTIESTYINFSERDEESAKNNAAFKNRVHLKFNDENGFFAKIRDPQ
jgi:hypothetical protein